MYQATGNWPLSGRDDLSGAEFANISKADYLRLTQELRDAPATGSILEAKQPTGVITHFDKRHGYFGGYNPDGMIRTFFIPNDREYFHRHARRTHD